MAEISLSRDAHFDLLEIWSIVARHDLAAADRLAGRFDQHFQTLAANPHSAGPRRVCIPICGCCQWVIT